MKTIIWDYNGTILDDTGLCLEIENRMLQKHGILRRYTMEQYRDLFCFPVRRYYEKLGYDFTKVSYELISDEFYTEYERGFSNCGLVEGVEEKLEQAKQLGYRNVIISACEHSVLLKQIEVLGIGGYFDSVNGLSDRLSASKIDMARGWMTANRVNPADCHMIGDTLHDLETAEALRLARCTLVACGHQSYRVMKEKSGNVKHSMKDVQL